MKRSPSTRYLRFVFHPIILWLRATLDRVKQDEGGNARVTWVPIAFICFVMAIVVGAIIRVLFNL